MMTIPPSRGLRDMLSEIRRLPDCHAVERLSVAVYDPRRNSLRAFAAASLGFDPLDNYEIDLEEVPSLVILATGDTPRIVDDLSVYGRDSSVHTHALRVAGYQSSLTVPVNRHDEFLGFVFFNAVIKRFFSPAVVGRLLPRAAAIFAAVQPPSSSQA